jgi:hypothetical protein
MSRLDDFLNLPDVSEVISEIKMERLGTFTVKPLTQEKHEEFQKRCRTKNRKGEIDFDMSKFNLLVIANQVINPDMNNADFLTKVGCQTARDFIQKKFKAGEIFELAQKICEISGFDAEINELVEESKN